MQWRRHPYYTYRKLSKKEGIHIDLSFLHVGLMGEGATLEKSPIWSPPVSGFPREGRREKKPAQSALHHSCLGVQGEVRHILLCVVHRRAGPGWTCILLWQSWPDWAHPLLHGKGWAMHILHPMQGKGHWLWWHMVSYPCIGQRPLAGVADHVYLWIRWRLPSSWVRGGGGGRSPQPICTFPESQYP